MWGPGPNPGLHNKLNQIKTRNLQVHLKRFYQKSLTAMFLPLGRMCNFVIVTLQLFVIAIINSLSLNFTRLRALNFAI